MGVIKTIQLTDGTLCPINGVLFAKATTVDSNYVIPLSIPNVSGVFEGMSIRVWFDFSILSTDPNRYKFNINNTGAYIINREAVPYTNASYDDKSTSIRIRGHQIYDFTFIDSKWVITGDDRLGDPTIIGANHDMDLLEPGLYYSSGTRIPLHGPPTFPNNAIIIVTSIRENDRFQIMHGLNAPTRLYFRSGYLNNGVMNFNPWYYIAGQQA